MTYIPGNPAPHRVNVPVFPNRRTRHATTPFPGLCLLVMGWAVAAFLYVVGLVSAFPRSDRHDAILVSAFCLSFSAGLCWEGVKRIPCIGWVIYALPTLALIAVPFGLDVYLIARR
jgi:hypothetical protein